MEPIVGVAFTIEFLDLVWSLESGGPAWSPMQLLGLESPDPSYALIKLKSISEVVGLNM